MASAARAWLTCALGVLALNGCGVSEEAKRICERASERWVGCVREAAGERMAAEMEAMRDIGACARDSAVVESYRRCLERPTCDALMECMGIAAP